MHKRLLPAFAIMLCILTACENKSTDPNAQNSAPEAANTSQKPSSKDISSRITEGRATEAVIWGTPAVNYDLMVQAALHAKASFNQVVYWSRLPSWKNQTLTPNPDAIYLMPFVNTQQAGPMVLEIPPAAGGSITGSVDDAWQEALEDVGPAGADKGKGGKYLILPPSYKGKAPNGYISLPSNTFESFALLRSNLNSGSDADIAKAVEYGKRVKLYPLAQAAHPPETSFVDVIDAVYDSTIPYDARFFQSLDRVVQNEPWLERDKAMISQLKSIGIEKGKPFSPDPAMQETLKRGASQGHLWLDAHYDAAFKPPYNEGAHWAVPVPPDTIGGMQTHFSKPASYPIDDRGAMYSMGFFSAKHLGQGQFYLMTINDKDGKPLEAGSTYRLTVPANPPVTLYWSATVYDRATHAFIREAQWSSPSSHTPGLQRNADGSVDAYFSPKAPTGKESNWVPTNVSGGFEVLFRLYGPQKPVYDRTWKLPDIEKVQNP